MNILKSLYVKNYAFFKTADPMDYVNFPEGYEYAYSSETGCKTLFTNEELDSEEVSALFEKYFREPTSDELAEIFAQHRKDKKAEVSAACEQIIYSGITIDLSNGPEHLSLTEKDQINLFGKQAQLAAGADRLEYHQDDHPCRYYSAAEMQQIITAAMEHVSYHTTYCNSLNMWIGGTETAEELETIFYGADVPEEYQSEVLKDYLAKVMGGENETTV